MGLETALQHAWLRRGLLAWTLWPISRVFGMLAGLRRWAFRSGLLRSERIGVPVIVVGNVVAGGAGKTPVVMALVQLLQARGLTPGVVSRGHGRTRIGCQEVHAGSDPADVGDEPLLVARRTGAPVVVGASRAAAARALLGAHPECRVVISDDGLQHYGMQRDVEICVFDERGIGNGWLLPAGPLREPWPRAVDLVLRSGRPAGIAGFDVRRRLAPSARRADGVEIPLADLTRRPVTAVAAIGRPEAFFAMLRERGLQLARTVALPDHDAFGALPRDLQSAELVCTEKDAVKLWRLRPDAWAVPLLVELDPAFRDALDRLLDAKLSSRHGPQTA